jgi:protein SCO1
MQSRASRPNGVDRNMPRRLAQLLTALAYLVGLSACGGGGAALTGTDLGQQVAPDFSLTDQRGQTVSLSALRGHPIALTFIYTNCVDICPLTAEHLRAAWEQLPSGTRDKVVLLAVTVDPARDSQAALLAFSVEHQLADNPAWHALRGDAMALQQVWSGYAIDPGELLAMQATPMMALTPTTGTLSHSDAIYIIDTQGRERVLLHSDTAPNVLANDLKALAT